MRKIGYLFCFGIIVLCMSACSLQNNSLKNMEVNKIEETEKENVTSSDGKYNTFGFQDMIGDNPIDKEYDKKVYNGETTQYIMQTLELLTSIYEENNYEVAGNSHWMGVWDENLRKTRERSLEIIEYICAAGGEYTFIYSNSQ